MRHCCLILIAAAMFAATITHAQDFAVFESGQVRPLALSPDGQRLFAVNTPDNRLEIYAVGSAGLHHTGSVRVGMEPVAVAARNNEEVWVVNHLSDSISVISLTPTPRVTRTLLVGDEPNDIVFGGPGGNRAFVTAAHRGQNSPYPRGDYEVPGTGRADVWVFDAANLGASLGGSPLTIVTLFGDKPRALTVSDDGSRVYAAVFHSGNRTTTISEGIVCNSPGPCAIDIGTAPGPLPPPTANFAGTTGPQTGLIVQHDPVTGDWTDELGRDWRDGVRFDLPDYDVFEIDANAALPVELARYAGVGTILFNMLYDAARDTVWVTNTEANNRVRFEGEGVVAGAVKPAAEPASVIGNLHRSQMTAVNVGTGVVTPRHLNKHIPYGTHPVPAGIKEASLATPLGAALSADGTQLYVAGFGSQAIGVYDADALLDDSFDPLAGSQINLSGGGPTGLVLDESRGRLYVLTRFDNTLSVIDLVSASESARYALPNPEPQSVVDGRPFLYDARLTSSNGEASCSSCHVFGDMDDLAWDLGDPDAAVEDNDNPFTVGGVGNEIFHPMKGPMTTQSLRGMADHGPMHWRGDRTGASSGGSALDEDAAFKAFNGAFGGLLGRDEGELTEPQMQAFTDFVLQLRYPPNPIRQLDNSLRADEQRGLVAYFQTPGPDLVQSCNGCHTLDRSAGFFGGNGNSSIEGEPQEFKIAHLRNQYQKVGMFGMPNVSFNIPTDNSHQGDQVRGFGFLHDGSTDTAFRFFHATVFNAGFNAFFPDPPKTRRDLEALMMAFDTNYFPIVGQQITLTAANYDPLPAANTDAEERINLFVAQSLQSRNDVIAHIRGPNGSEGALFNGTLFARDADAAAALTLQELKDLVTLDSQTTITFTAVPPGSGTRMALDRDSDLILDGDDVCPAIANPDQADGDGDGVGDVCDRCILVSNAGQQDTDGDGYGNACDADLSNDGVINTQDLGLLKLAFFASGDLAADFNGDGVVNTQDLGIMKASFFGAPGPSALR